MHSKRSEYGTNLFVNRGRACTKSWYGIISSVSGRACTRSGFGTVSLSYRLILAVPVRELRTVQFRYS